MVERIYSDILYTSPYHVTLICCFWCGYWFSTFCVMIVSVISSSESYIFNYTYRNMKGEHQLLISSFVLLLP